MGTLEGDCTAIPSSSSSGPLEVVIINKEHASQVMVQVTEFRELETVIPTQKNKGGVAG